MGALGNEADTPAPNDAPSYQVHYEFVLLQCPCLSSRLVQKWPEKQSQSTKLSGGSHPSCCVVTVMCSPPLPPTILLPVYILQHL